MKRLLLLYFVTLIVTLSGCEKINTNGDGGDDGQSASIQLAGTSWGRKYTGSRLSCKLIFTESTCTVTMYSDEVYHNVQSSSSTHYSIKGNRIVFGDNFVVSVVPPLNNQQQYRRFKYALIESRSKIQVDIDVKVGNGSWSGTGLATFNKL